jgi:hypothetical protein
MSRSLRDLARPPFGTLLMLNLFLHVVSGAVPGTDFVDLLLTLIVIVASVYVEIAVTLAAGSGQPGRSGDAWFRSALRRRCFWRVVGVQLVTLVLVAGGLLVLVVGALMVGGMVSLAEAAVVLERAGPLEAVRRSVQLGRPARAPLVLVFALLVLAPAIAGQGTFFLGLSRLSTVLLGLPFVVLSMAGTLALTRAFVALGGAPSGEDLHAPRRLVA